MDWAKTTARQDQKYLGFNVPYIRGLTVVTLVLIVPCFLGLPTIPHEQEFSSKPQQHGQLSDAQEVAQWREEMPQGIRHGEPWPLVYSMQMEEGLLAFQRIKVFMDWSALGLPYPWLHKQLIRGGSPLIRGMELWKFKSSSCG